MSVRNSTASAIRANLEITAPGALLLPEEFDAALEGTAQVGAGEIRACYSFNTVFQTLRGMGMSHQEATDAFRENFASEGPGAPIFFTAPDVPTF